MPQARGTAAVSVRPPSRLPTHVVHRPRLVEAMNGAGARLVLVTGPAGSGKTVAVLDWARRAEVPVAWLALDSSHTDPEHFLESLLGVLDEVAPGLRDATWRDEPGDHAADRALERAAGHLATAPRATVVLDDLHVIDRSPTARFLARLVEVIPATNLTLVICSRSDPPMQLHRFRLSGELVELREADLRFDPSEAAAFFARFPAVELDDEHIARLADRTEGWVAGLQFAALSLAGRDDAAAFVERFTGSARHVADFLLDEVLDRQPDDVREFLLATSVLDRLQADLCEHVTGRSDAAALLRRLEAEHLFLVPLDDERAWFRYHHLFGQLLRRELRLTDPEREQRGHERAAEWFIDHDQPARAIDHLLDARELEPAFELVTRHLREHLGAGRHETVRGWLSRFPASFVDSTPGRQVFMAVACSRAGLVDRGREVLERARARLRAGAPEVTGLELHCDVGESVLLSVLGDPETSIALGVRSWERRDEVDLAALPDDLSTAAREAWGYLPLGLARAHALLDDRAGTRRWAAVMRRNGPRLPGDLVGILGAEAWAEARSGRLRSAAELADQALVMGTDYGRGARRTMIGARVALALVHREQDDLDRAVDVLAPHLDAALREGHVAITTLGEAELARVECAQGRCEDAISRLLRLRRDRAARGLSPFLASVIDRAECRVRLQRGDLDRVRDLLEDIEPGPERTLLTARTAVVAGDLDAVEPLLAELTLAPDDRRGEWEAAALVARAAADRGDLVAARRVLGTVADVARREGVVRTFLDEGFDIAEVVAAHDLPIAPRPPHVATRATALEGNRRLIEPLSERELAVLRYLPSRLSNREIGAELYVSLNTVKSHVKTIYRKLDVENRDDAVRRARQLGMI
jgi:LuxR family transcriptional regulator, maltose regulon positive regulatory protein